MNVNTIGTGLTLAAAQSSTLRSAMASSNAASEVLPDSAGGQAQVSGPAALMNKLKTLQQTDPDKLKAVLGELADTISEKANSATDPGEKRALSELAEKFKAAGESGDLSSLQPPRGPGGKGGPPPGPPPSGGAKPAASASSSGASSATEEFDPADTNEDGSVSQREKLAYEAKQAASASGAEAYAKQAAFGQREKVNALFDSLNTTLDAAL